MKRGRKYHDCGEEYNVEKGKGKTLKLQLQKALRSNQRCKQQQQKGSNIILSLMLRLL